MPNPGRRFAPGEEHSWFEVHETLGTVVQWAAPAVAVLAIWQGRRLAEPRWMILLAAALWVLALLVLLTAHYGGSLAWHEAGA